MVQEYARGITLRELINSIGPIREERALRIFGQIANALSYAHAKGVIHRDVKPSNIMVDIENGDTVQVMDFGIARLMNDIHLTMTGDTIGTVNYMSPEQVVALKDIDNRSDVYSAGVVLYEMLSGKLPFDTDTSSAFHIQNAIVNKEVPDPRLVYPGISEKTVNLVRLLTIKDREHRPRVFPDLNNLPHENLSEDIKPVPITPEEMPPQPATVISIAPRQKKGKKGFFIAAAIIVAVAVAGYFGFQSQAEAREILRVNQSSNFISVDGGVLEMGSERGDPDELPVHSVYVSGFHIANFEVTQSLWENVMGSNPSGNQGPVKPVENVSWLQAVEFCNALSRRDGFTPCYEINGAQTSCNWNANGYRLPTAAEWEFAARGGTYSGNYEYSGSNDFDEVAFSQSSSAGQTHNVGKKKANELGLHDMSGNVWEWCWDSYDETYYRQSPYENPRGAKPGHIRCMRGGAWNRGQGRCRTADRGKGSFDYLANNVGFRLVRTRN